MDVLGAGGAGGLLGAGGAGNAVMIALHIDLTFQRLSRKSLAGWWQGYGSRELVLSRRISPV